MSLTQGMKAKQLLGYYQNKAAEAAALKPAGSDATGL